MLENKTKTQKTLLKIILAVAIIAFGIVVINSINEQLEKKSLYSSTISAIEDKNYGTARNLAYKYWVAYDDKALFTLVQVLEFDSDLDSLIIMNELRDYNLKQFKKDLAYFTDNYSGYMSEYILDVKAREDEITRKCEEYFESVEKAEQEAEEERIKKLKVNPPYEGLSEDDIGNTSWGNPIYTKKVSLYTYSNVLKNTG